jgi:hypothetical protein
MTGPVITPVSFPTGAHTGTDRHQRPSATGAGLPLTVVPTRRSHTIVYGMAAADSRGRVAQKAVLRALDWAPNTRIDIHETHNVLVIRPNPQGVFRVTPEGHLRLPAQVRHCCDLHPGDRVLLAADPEHGLLVVHPPAVLDGLITAAFADLWSNPS